MPQRIQLRRTKGWRKPGGAIVVARPSKWGNPYLLGDVLRRFPSLTIEQCRGFAVNEFRDLVFAGTITDSLPTLNGPREIRTYTYPSVAEIRSELRGHDLACWCPLVDATGDPVPCHADVLLKWANQ